MVVPIREEARRRRPRRSPAGRWLRPLLAAAAGVVALVGSPLPAAAGPAGVAHGGQASAAGGYIVRAQPGRLDELAALLRDRHLQVQRRIGIIDAAVVTLPAGAADALRADPRVASVTPNAAVRMLADGYVPGQDVNSMYSLGNMVGTRGWWNKYTGVGIDVALIDSGVAPVVGLSDTGKIVNGPDLSFESQAPNLRNLDTYGHGTHMAGIIAGHDPGVNPATSAGNSKVFLGVAPNARIVSVKVADAHGNSDVSQVIAGIDWVVQHAKDPDMNVRVLNLSFGTDSAQAYTLDPLAFAVEVAWRKGITVVTSAGNSGAADGRLTNPAIDPFVIAVGADDLNGSPSIDDDTIPAFSSRGNGIRDPDFVAPGAHVQSLRVPGSYIDTQYGATGGINDRFFRGSGTSQAAAFVSGSLALMFQKYPTMTPDQAKKLLASTTSPLKAADPQAQGSGLINMRNVAGKAPVPTAQAFPPALGTGSLEAARGTAHVADPDTGVELVGEQDIMGQPWNSLTWTQAAATGTAWTGGVWNGSTWSGSDWSGSSWTARTWSDSAWTARTWSDSSWTARTWSDAAWSASTWD